MNTRIETITPERAKMALENNPNNRRVSIANVKKYAEDMRSGNWQLNGEPICFDSHGNLLNGQHRLEACILADTPFMTVVAYDVEATTFDRGHGRTFSNILEMNGYSKTFQRPIITGAINCLLRNAKYYTPSDTQLKKVMDGLKEYILKVSEMIPSNCQVSSKSGCVAASIVALYYGVDETIIRNFLSVVDSGFATSQTQFAAIVARNFLMQKQGVSGGRQRVHECYNVILQAIIDFKNGTPRKRAYNKETKVIWASGMNEVVKSFLE